MYGVPETTNSRVPDIRPGRPEDGNRSRSSTALRIAATVLSAADGLSREIYSAKASKLLIAARSHSTRTTRPLLQHPLHFLLAGKVTGVGLGYTFLDFIDLPFIHADKLLDRLGREARATSIQRYRQTVELAFKFGMQPDSENRECRKGVN